MFPLLETAIGFVAIMLVLSFLVKSLTTLISDHFDFYCDNFQYEASRLIRNLTGKKWETCAAAANVLARAPWVKDVKWERLGDEFFSEENIKWVVTQLEPAAAMGSLKGLIQVHQSKVKYAFQQRLKNLSIAVGLGLCLFLDVNGLSIWNTLYHNDQLRTTFASEYATNALTLGANSPVSATRSENPPQQAADRQKAEENLSKARAEFSARLNDFVSDVSFGVGRVWRREGPDRPAGLRGWMVEFIGAFLTGILVSVGAPYWHDLLENLSALRQKPAGSN